MKFTPISIQGAYLIQLSPAADDRGSFSRLFCNKELETIGHTKNIVQVNHSITKQAGTVRGMHFQQAPHSEIKMIRCLRGKVFDVLVDLREGSATFLQWYGIELSPAMYQMIYIPKGCAHGFQALENDSELIYFHSDFYNAESESAVRFDDPMLSIKWPLTPVNISERDKNHSLLNKSFSGIEVL